MRALLRGGHDDAQIAGAIGLIWQQRGDRYSQLRSSQSHAPGLPLAEGQSAPRRVEMHYIGG